MRTLLTIAAITALAACGQETQPAAPNTTAEVQTPAPAEPTIIVLTENDARTRLDAAGYTDVTGLVQNPDGSWSASGMMNGETTQVTVSETGVSVVTTP